EDVQRVPLILLKISTAIMRIFAPQQPWWKFNILLNLLEKKLGIMAIKELLFKCKNREALASL
ncbi:MAG: hypothetical protein MUF15_24235, partial [Acidobacteria bacterium]|nr:hypothetical protein [Acidobacteriota bacterium]